MDCWFLNLKRVNCYTLLPISINNLRMDYYYHTPIYRLYLLPRIIGFGVFPRIKQIKTNFQIGDTSRLHLLSVDRYIQLIYCEIINFKVFRFCVIVSLVKVVCSKFKKLNRRFPICSYLHNPTQTIKKLSNLFKPFLVIF